MSKLNYKEGLVLFFAAWISGQALPPFGHIWVLFLTYPLFFYFIGKAQSKKEAFWKGAFFGAVYFVFSLFWATAAFNLKTLAIFYFCFGFSIWGALFYALPAYFSTFLPQGKKRLFALAFFFSLFEWFRTYFLTGLPWNLTSSIFVISPEIFQNLSWMGPYLLGLLAILFFICPLFILKPYRNLLFPVLMLSLFGAFFYWGQVRLQKATHAYVPHVKLRIVQHHVRNVSEYIVKKRNHQFDSFEKLISQKPYDDITHFLFAENSVISYEDPKVVPPYVVKAIPKGKTFILGMIRRLIGASYNSIIVINDTGKMEFVYDKWHLLPIGEYIPFQSFVPWIKPITNNANNLRGSGPKTYDFKDAPPAAFVNCFEIIFPGSIVDKTHRAKWIINASGDNWYIDSEGPYQHLVAAQMRAIEEGLPIARPVQTGISAMINPYGQIEKSLPGEVIGTFDTRLPKALPLTPFAKYGNLLYFTFLFLGLFLLFKKEVFPFMKKGILLFKERLSSFRK
ncbi:MAG: apolipoprotein N-acyltransferase [Alphaproteobacteria bacterium]|nr:apolipoprotein N-acyltransferase [Alphaproteobacteria bacterium]